MGSDRSAARGDGRWATLAAASRAWRRFPKLGAVSVGALVVQQAFSIGFAFSLKDIVGDITGHGSADRLTVLLAILAAGFVLAAASTVIGERASARAAAAITNGVRRELYSRLLRVSPAYLLGTSAAKVSTRFTNNIKSLEGGYIQGFLDSVTIGISGLIAAPLLVLLDWRLAILVAVALPLVVFAANRRLPRFVATNDAMSSSEFAIVSAVQDTVHAHEVVRTFHLEPLLVERFDELLATHESRIVEGHGVAASVGKGASLAVLLVEVVVVTVGAELAVHDHLSVGSLVGFITVLGLLAQNVYSYVRTDLPLLADAGRGRRSLDQLLTTPMVVEDSPAATDLPTVAGEIRIEDLTFTYPSADTPALAGVSALVPAGAHVAVVGTNGSGKSTLLRLLMRFYDPQLGSILIDGVDVRAVTRQSLRRQLSAVLQGNFIFNDTVRENIRMGRPDATDDEVVAGARRAELDDFVSLLPDGYDTVVGDGGGRLSVGQRQRIAIARAMIRDPAILLLDEVTTALDPVTESAVNEMLARTGEGRTVVSATHRLAAAQGSDLILVLDRGRLVELGRHEDLLAADGQYRRLWDKQSGFDVRGDGRQAAVSAQRLRHITLFTDLDDDVLTRIAAGLTSEFYEADQLVFAEGDPGERFYLIARGRVAVLTAGDGDEHLLETLGDGDHFGELALLQDRPRTATIRTTAPSVFLTMSRAAFIELVATTPEMGRMLEDRVTRSELNLGEWRRLIGRGSR